MKQRSTFIALLLTYILIAAGSDQNVSIFPVPQPTPIESSSRKLKEEPGKPLQSQTNPTNPECSIRLFIDKYSLKGQITISSAIKTISRRYKLPAIAFLNAAKCNEYSIHCHTVRDLRREYVVFDRVCRRAYDQWRLRALPQCLDNLTIIVQKPYVCSKKGKEQKWRGRVVLPHFKTAAAHMSWYVAHEVGHHFIKKIPKQKREELLAKFHEIDLKSSTLPSSFLKVDGEYLILGHTTPYSAKHNLKDINSKDPSTRIKHLEEQLAEMFAYRSLGFRYSHKDPFFKAKYEHAIVELKKLEK